MSHRIVNLSSYLCIRKFHKIITNMSQQKQTIKLEFPQSENSIDLPIGTHLSIGKIKYQIVLAEHGRLAASCDGCMMSARYCPAFRCSGIGRHDHKEVIFTITDPE